MEMGLAAVASGMGVIVMGLVGLIWRGSNSGNGAIHRIDERTERMVSLLEVIADRGERSN